MCTSVSSSTSAEKIQEYHKLILWTSDPCQKNDRAIRFTRSTSIHWFLRLYSIKMPIEKVQHGMTACGKEKRFTQPKYMQQSHKHHKKKKQPAETLQTMPALQRISICHVIIISNLKSHVESENGNPLQMFVSIMDALHKLQKQCVPCYFIKSYCVKIWFVNKHEPTCSVRSRKQHPDPLHTTWQTFLYLI